MKRKESKSRWTRHRQHPQEKADLVAPRAGGYLSPVRLSFLVLMGCAVTGLVLNFNVQGLSSKFHSAIVDNAGFQDAAAADHAEEDRRMSMGIREQASASSATFPAPTPLPQADGAELTPRVNDAGAAVGTRDAGSASGTRDAGLAPEANGAGAVLSVEAALAGAVPTFAFSPHGQLDAKVCKEGKEFFFNQWKWNTRDPLEKPPHPSLVTDEHAAQFSHVCCFRVFLELFDEPCNRTGIEEFIRSRFASLPLRSPDRPYLVFAHGLNAEGGKGIKYRWVREVLSERKDFLYLHYDLRGHRLDDDSAPLLPGVTMPAPLYYRGRLKKNGSNERVPADPDRPPRFLMTFRGSLRKRGRQGKRHCRMMLNRSVHNITREGVAIEFSTPRADALMGGLVATPKDDKRRYDELMDTAYALMLRGVDRWTYRFSEAIGACAIPVLLADGRDEGATLPFEELIDWSKVTVHLGDKLGIKGEQPILEHLLKYPDDIHRHLPSSPDAIRAMRRAICDINERYFATKLKRAESVMRCAAIVAARRANKSHG